MLTAFDVLRWSLAFRDTNDWEPSLPLQVYPATAFLPPSGGQRGSLLNVDGDPQTPGWPSEEGGERLSRKDTLPFLPELPALPISYSAASHILRQMGGREAPEEWRGALNLTYRLGPGPVRVNMDVQVGEREGVLYRVWGAAWGKREGVLYKGGGGQHGRREGRSRSPEDVL